MATIALYAGKINNMPGLIKDVRKSVEKYNIKRWRVKLVGCNDIFWRWFSQRVYDWWNNGRAFNGGECCISL